MNEQEALKRFIEQVRWLYEPEYGDFKRKVGLYIDRLSETYPGLDLAGLKSHVVYNPSGDIERTRRDVISMAAELLVDPSGQIH